MTDGDVSARIVLGGRGVSVVKPAGSACQVVIESEQKETAELFFRVSPRRQWGQHQRLGAAPGCS